MIWVLLACGTPVAPSNTAPTPGEAPAPVAVALPDRFDLGRPATDAEIAAWDIDVNPSWDNLPQGRGTVAEGKQLFAAQCAACHGLDGKSGPGMLGPLLVASEPKDGLQDDYKAPRAIGNWWPYASTVYDYVHRAMPQVAPGSLSPDQTYALVAFLLAENDVVADDFVADQDSIRAVKMPTHVTFVRDDRESTNQFR